MKLIKTIFIGGQCEYALYAEELGYELSPCAKSGVGHGYYKLSEENCKNLFSGIDVDSLSYDFAYNHQSDPNHGDTIDIFKKGLNKGLELTADKKFTEQDVENIIDVAVQWALRTKGVGETYQEMSKRAVSYSKPTEIEVEFVMEDSEPAGEQVWQNVKKDSQGCIVLKLKDKVFYL